MQYSFQQKALEEIEKTAEKLKNLGYSVTLPIKKVYNYEIDIDTHKNRVKFLIYFGKKGLKKILQGDSDSKFYKEIKKHLFDEELFDSASTDIEEFDDYVGTDESGKGDYFGPLVIAGVYINKNDSTELLKLGVKDSKLLSDYQIKNMSKQLLEVVKNNYDIVIIKPEKYNQLYSSFGNLNKLLAWGHSKVIENLKSKINFSNVISDKFGDENLILNELQKKEIAINLIQTPKAERFIAVAAASILARAKVIEWFERASRELEIDLVKGASDKVDKIAKSVLEQTSEENLKKLVKFHFKNSKSIKK
jgi:ribonuclease HIII